MILKCNSNYIFEKDLEVLWVVFNSFFIPRYKKKISRYFYSFGIRPRTARNINNISFRFEFCFGTTTTTLVEFDEKLSEEKFFSSLYPFEIQWCFRFSLIFYPRINFFRVVSKFFLICNLIKREITFHIAQSFLLTKNMQKLKLHKTMFPK